MTLQRVSVRPENKIVVGHASENDPLPLSSSQNGVSKPDELEPIAIVGMAMGFPQGNTSSEALWKTILGKMSTSTVFPKSRMNIDAMYHPDANRKGQIPVNRGHFLEQDVAAFDAGFFATSSTDAASMDPQQRLLLEYTYLALENAGVPMEAVAGSRTSVYTGCFSTDWQHLSFRDSEECATTSALGASPSLNANRVSWFFDFRGNSANVDTACSSSLVCLDLGCQGLRSGAEDMSIIAGSNVILSPDNMHSLTNVNMLSPDGECYSFDHRGNGYSRGEGVGILVLKRVTDAISNGDTIRGIIRSSGCNQDGRTPGITVSSPAAQTKLIQECYAKANLSMDPVRFFEAHGTGTPVGDPNEANGLGNAFRHVRSTTDPLAIGAIKSNIGHLEGASGIAGVIKAIMVLEKAIIPANVNFERLNSKIDADFYHLRFPTEASPWPCRGLRRASVNSFGNGGSNAHVILDDVYHFSKERGLKAHHCTVDEPPSQDQCTAQPPPNWPPKVSNAKALTPRLLVFSAADEEGVKRLAKSYEKYFSDRSVPPAREQKYLDDLAYTLSLRRSRLRWRSFAVVRSLQDIVHLNEFISQAKTRSSNSQPGVAFVFSGQGAQWAGMGRELMVFPVFQQCLASLEQYLLEIGCIWNLRAELLQEKARSQIDHPEFAQTLCTAIQIALVKLFRSYNVFPSAVIGHSSGEVAAAYCTGALTSTSAIRVAYFRGKLAGQLTKDESVRGAMMSVALSEHKVVPYIEQATTSNGDSNDLVVACINSPTNVTISGDSGQIDALGAILEPAGIFHRKLAVPVAYHSSHMQALADEYGQRIGQLQARSSSFKRIPMFSSVTGMEIQPEELISPHYWVRNLTSPVKFSQAFSALCSRRSIKPTKKLDLSHRKRLEVSLLIEIGPHAVLQRPVMETLPMIPGCADIGYLSSLLRGTHAAETFLNAIGKIFCLGYNVQIDPTNLTSDGSAGFSLPDLPGYSFNHSNRYWAESRISAQYRHNEQGRLDLLGKPVADWNPLEPRWRNHLRTSEMPWIEDHVINGSMIYPGAGMLVMAIEAMYQMADKSRHIEGIEMEKVSFTRHLAISSSPEGSETQVSLQMGNNKFKENHWCEFRIFTFENNAWQSCCQGFVRPRYEISQNNVAAVSGSSYLLDKCSRLMHSLANSRPHILNPTSFYGNLNKAGFQLGPSFHRIQSAKYDSNGYVVAELRPYEWPEHQFPNRHIVHPTTLDSIFHTALVASIKGKPDFMETMVPTELEYFYVRSEGLAFHDHNTILECAWLEKETPRLTEFGGIILNHDKTTAVAEFSNLVLTKIARSGDEAVDEAAQVPQKAFHVQFSPDIDCLSAEQVIAYCGSESPRPSLRSFMKLLAHKYPDLGILEIGSESLGVNTLSIPQDLTVVGAGVNSMHALYGHYHYATDAPNFLEAAENKLRDFPDTTFELITPGVIPLNKSNGRKWDVILVPWSTLDHSNAIEDIENVLETNGRLILLDDKAEEPTVSEQLGLLEKSFQTQSLSLWSHSWRFVVLQRATRPVLNEARANVNLICESTSSLQMRFCRGISSVLEAQSIQVSIMSLAEAATNPMAGHIHMSMLEVDSPFLYSITEEQYDHLKSLLLFAEDIVWVKCGRFPNCPLPEHSMIEGITRVLQHEREELRTTTISLENNDELTNLQLDHIVRVIHDHINKVDRRENEYAETNGLITIPRISPSILAAEKIHQKSLSQSIRSSLVETSPPLKLSIRSVGLLDSLYWMEDQSSEGSLFEDEIELKIEAVGLNYADCLTVLGQNMESSIGYECAGIVTRAGAESGFVDGDRVVSFADDTFKTVTRVKASSALRIPETMPFCDAASIPTQFVTAWQVINNVSRLQKDETILIHAASGGTGQAAIQIAKLLGARILATVGSLPKKKLLIERFNIPESHIFFSRDTSFAERVKRVTDGRGVDVAINSLPGDIGVATCSCLAPYGRLVNIATADKGTTTSSARILPRNASLIDFDGISFRRDKPVMVKDILVTILKKFADGTLNIAYPFHVYDISEVRQAFTSLANGELSGKVVISLHDKSEVEITSKSKPSFVAEADSTYVIAGGLGGLGRATARWLAERGARNMILLSRRGPRTQSAFDLIADLQAKAVRIETPACDITDLAQLQLILGPLMEEMPPIKGCIQSCVITKDSLLGDLAYADWRAAVECKTVGSWNLHCVMPSSMDFFILFASASGLAGLRGQSNYNAGNCYQDAFARYRVGRGEKAVVLDLGAMKDDGILAEAPELLNRVMGYGLLEPVDRQTFYAVLDYFCDPSLPILSPEDCQFIYGIGVGGGESLESFDYSQHQMMYPLQVLGDKQSRNSPLATQKAKANYGALYSSSESLDRASEIVADAVADKLGKSLSSMANRDFIELHQPLQALGVDSLLAVDLRNWVAKEFMADVAVFETQGSATLETLGNLIARKSKLKHDQWVIGNQ